MGEHKIKRESKPPRHIPLTPEQLHTRAVERMKHAQALRMLGIPVTNRAPHAPMGTPPRRHYPRVAATSANVIIKHPEKYLLSAARRRVAT